MAPTPGVEYVKLFIVDVRPSATSVDVIVKAAQPCRVFCAAIRDEEFSIPSISGSMVRHSTSGSLQEAHRKSGLYANMTITDLQPMSRYRVHCYSEDWGLPPHAMPDWKVRDTYKAVDTGCCATFSLPSFPKNLRKLIPTKPAILTAPVPGISVVINASYCGNVTSSMDCRLHVSGDDCIPDPDQQYLRLNPEPRLNLTTAAAAGAGRPLSLYAMESGCFILNYTLQGPAVDQGYYGAPRIGHNQLQQVVFFHSWRDPIPAPNISWARFTDTGAEVEVAFEYETDRGNLQGLFPCSRILNFTARSTAASVAEYSSNRMAGGAQCRWKSSSILVVTLLPASTLLPSDFLSLAPQRLRARCTAVSAADDPSSLQACGTWPRNAAGAPIEIARPEHPVIPVPSLLYARKLSPCSDLVVDAVASSGSAGRPMLYYWTVQGGTLANLTDYLEDSGVNPQANVSNWARGGTYKGTSLLRIPRAILEPDTTYTVTLFLLNFLGASAISQPGVIRISGYGNGTSAASVATVQIMPSTVEIYRWQALELYGDVSVSYCAPVAVNISFVEPAADHLVIDFGWELTGGGGQVLRSQSRDPRYFKLPPTVLQTGYTYNVTVRVNVTLQWAISAGEAAGGYKVEKIQATGSVAIYVKKSTPLLEIRGGDRMIGLGTPLTLDARTSIDPDDLEGGIAALNLTWYCIRGGDLYGRSCNLPALPTGPHPRIGLLPALGVYIFTVVANKVGLRGPAATSVTVTATSTPLAPVTRVNRHQSLSIYTYKTGAVNPSAKVAFVGTVAAINRMENMSYYWELLDGYLAKPGLTLADVATTPTRGRGIKVEAGAVLPWSLALLPGSLIPGSTYTFRLVVRDGEDSVSAQLDFTTNRPPAFGTVAVTPTSGKALHTRFEVVTSDWLDDPEDYPLHYEFFVDEASSSILNRTSAAVAWRYMLAYRRPLPSLSGALLPTSPNTGSLVVSTCATDTYNATGCATRGASVQVRNLDAWSLELRQNITDLFMAALNTQNMDAAAATVLMALASIRSSEDSWLSSCDDPSARDCSAAGLVASLLPLLARITSVQDPTPQRVEQQAAILDLMLGSDRHPLALKLDGGLAVLETITAHAAVTGLNGNRALASRLACAASNLLDDEAGPPESLGPRRRVASLAVANLARASWNDLVPTEEGLQISCPQMNFTSRAVFGVIFENSSALVLRNIHELIMPSEEVSGLLGEQSISAIDELYTSLIVFNAEIHDGSTLPLNSPVLRFGLDIITNPDDIGGRRRLQPLTSSGAVLDLKNSRQNELQVRLWPRNISLVYEYNAFDTRLHPQKGEKAEGM
jgi:hypothetical protein